jgi:protoporphyrinogen oxidase
MEIGIIGGGATGLTAGYQLSKSGHKVAIYEKSEENLGGIAGAVPIHHTLIDKFYHHIFTSDTDILSLIEEVGLSGDMLWEEPKNGLYLGGKLYPFTNPIDLITFPEIGLVSRFRMGLAVLLAKGVRDFRALEDITAKDWLIQKTGQDAYDKIWQPLLYSKFDRDADQISGVWIWNKFKLRGSTRQSVSKECLGYLRGGFFRLYLKLAEEIQRSQNVLIPSEAVWISAAPGCKVQIQSENGMNIIYDKVIFAASPEELCQICEFPEDYLRRTRQIRHKANICMTLFLEKPVSDYYWITVAEPNAPFVLCVEHTNLIRDPDYGDCHILYLSRYLDASDLFFNASDDEIGPVFLAYLSRLFPQFDPADILGSHIFRSVYAQPVVSLRHSGHILPPETPIENLYLASMSQIYPEDRGQNYAIRMGREIAETIMKE